MNCQLKLAKPRKACTSLTVVGCGQSQIAVILLGSILIPLIPMMYLRNSTSGLLNSHFSGLSFNPACHRYLRTSLTCVVCSHCVFKYTRMSSR